MRWILIPGQCQGLTLYLNSAFLLWKPQLSALKVSPDKSSAMNALNQKIGALWKKGVSLTSVSMTLVAWLPIHISHGAWVYNRTMTGEGERCESRDKVELQCSSSLYWLYGLAFSPPLFWSSQTRSPAPSAFPYWTDGTLSCHTCELPPRLLHISHSCAHPVSV